ncbi:hypothetical protein AGMMS49982_19320 [Bacteroidia bacterium]|nr:hypothetical protein AGMMS49982_19320 [Bacteroidia bacterium]
MKVKLLLILLCLGVEIGSALAQDKTVAQDIVVRGVVVNEKLRPLPGVALSVAGEPSITDTTDAKGTFTLYVPRSAKQLVATYAGMRDETVNIAPQMRLTMRKAFSRNEFSAHAGVGASSLWYPPSPNVGNYKFSVGYDFGIGYTLFFSKNKTWAVSTGISFASFNSIYELATFTDAKYGIDDGYGGVFNHYDTISGYTESQHLSMLTIPLMLHFEKEVTETGKFYAALGVKFGLPVGTIDYKPDVQYLHTSGTIRRTEIINPESMGIGNVKRNRIDLSGGSTAKPKTAYFVSVETGMKWALTNEWSLYTGVYMDYGLNKVIETGGKELVGYDAAEFFANPSAKYRLAGMLSASADGKPFVDKVSPVSAGVRVALAFGKIPVKKVASPPPPPVAAPLPPPVDTVKVVQKTPAKKPKQQRQQRIVDKAPPVVVPPVVVPPPPDPPVDTVKVVRKTPVQETRQQRQQRIVDKARVQKPINFEVAKSDLLLASRAALDAEIRDLKSQLDEKITVLKKYPNWHIRIEGHTDDTGSQARNEILGQDRAETVKAYMIEQGIPAEIITETVSKAATEPLVPNNSVENRQKNRRVVIVIVKE